MSNWIKAEDVKAGDTVVLDHRGECLVQQVELNDKVTLTLKQGYRIADKYNFEPWQEIQVKR